MNKGGRRPIRGQLKNLSATNTTHVPTLLACGAAARAFGSIFEWKSFRKKPGCPRHSPTARSQSPRGPSKQVRGVFQPPIWNQRATRGRTGMLFAKRDTERRVEGCITNCSSSLMIVNACGFCLANFNSVATGVGQRLPPVEGALVKPLLFETRTVLGTLGFHAHFSEF